MTEAMKITLSPQPADARWGEKATYSINNDGITLHLNGADDTGNQFVAHDVFLA